MNFGLKFNRFLLILIFCVAGIVSDAFAQQGRRNPKISDFPLGDKTKFVALTFDDGPNTNETVQILNELKRIYTNVKVTFYVNGSNFNNETIPILQRMIAEGHDVCSHGFYHYTHGNQHPDSPVWLDTPEKARENIQRNSQAIFDVTSYWPFSFRAPFCEFGSQLEGLDVILNMPFVHARYDTKDWGQYNQTNPQGMATELISAVKDGTIILMHDAPAGNRQGTVDALKLFIPQLISQGYAFVTVRELFTIKQAQPERFQTDVHNPNAGLPFNEYNDSGKRWNHEDFWPDNANNWWMQDWWSCPTPPWERNLSVSCNVQIPPSCNICKNTPCTCGTVVPCELCLVCQECPCVCSGNTSVINKTKYRKHGILLENAVVSDIAKIGVKTPEVAQVNIKISDNLGNAVFETSGKSCETFKWNLRNNAGRLVANGTYWAVVEATGVSGKVYLYNARIGVRK